MTIGDESTPAPMCPECYTPLHKYGGSRITRYCGNQGCTRFAVRIVDAPRGPIGTVFLTPEEERAAWDQSFGSMASTRYYYCDACDRTYPRNNPAEMCRCSTAHWHSVNGAGGS